MSKTVLEIRPNGLNGSFWAFLIEPTTYDEATSIYPFPYNPTDPEPTGFVNGTLGADEMGAYILRKLSEHPAIVRALTEALATPPGSQKPLLVRVARQAESVPWETLFANGTFLALDPRWPIGRMSTSGPASADAREFRPPLRVLAVLAA